MNIADPNLRMARKIANQHWRVYEYNTGQTRLRSLPDVFAIESTNFCNLKCVMCPRGEPDLMERPLGHMSDEVFKKLVEGWEFFTEPCWLHLFGEPLMHPRLFDQIEFAKAAGMPNVGISSNATLLTKLNAAKILDSGLDTIILSIDGATKTTYESIRKSPAFTFEEVRENVRTFLEMRKRFRKAKPHTIVQIIRMHETEGEVDAFKAEWEAAGADEVRIKRYTIWGNQENHYDSFADLAPTDQRHLFQEAVPIARVNPCHYLWSAVVVAWDGRVVPCCFDYDTTVPLGDLRQQTLAEIWNGPAYVALREAELAGRNDNPLCRSCTEAPGYQRDPEAARPPAQLDPFLPPPPRPVEISAFAPGI
jgi:radical SAM protein with 4Fe4S-binding SPASM domain